MSSLGISDCAPVFIISPAARCGITLLQRLLNSTRKMVVYGENSMLVNKLPSHLLEISTVAPKLNEARLKLLGGDYDFWSSSIWPDPEAYARAIVENICRVAQSYEESARRDGFDRWGIKNPLIAPTVSSVLFQVFPKARFIFIYRHLRDVLRSYKARKWLAGSGRVAHVTEGWCANVTYMLAAPPSQRLLRLRYEELVKDAERAAQTLEAFVGVAGIDRSLFSHRVNTFDGQAANGHSNSGYVPPEPLTGDETRIAQKIAGATLEALGYPPLEPDEPTPGKTIAEPVPTTSRGETA